jgi:hypothetical protein
MRNWVTSKVDRICGHCNAIIPKGTRYQLIVIPAVTSPRLRCSDCIAREEAITINPVPLTPDDLPDDL